MQQNKASAKPHICRLQAATCCRVCSPYTCHPTSGNDKTTVVVVGLLPSSQAVHVHISESQNFPNHKKTGCCKGWSQAFLPLLIPVLPDGTNSAHHLFFSPSCPSPQLKNDLSAWCRYRAVVGSKIYKKTCTLLTLPFLMGQPILLTSLLSCRYFLWDILGFGLKNLKAPFVCHLTTEACFCLHSTQQTTTRLPEVCQNISVTKYL